MLEQLFAYTKLFVIAMASLAPPSGARKRPCNPESWKQNKAKNARDLGNEYESRSTWRTVAAKRVGEPCGCTKQCFDAVGMESINAIHRDYWASGNHTLQTAFIQQRTQEVDPESHYTNDAAMQRSCSRKFSFKVG